jgi:hypothetical protein
MPPKRMQAHQSVEPSQSWTDFAPKMAEWRAGVAMDKFKELRKMYNDAGVTIYAWKPNALGAKNTDAEIDYAFNAGKALGVIM